MKLRTKLAAVATIMLLLLPNAAYADSNNNRCDDRTEDDCRDKREKPRRNKKPILPASISMPSNCCISCCQDCLI